MFSIRFLGAAETVTGSRTLINCGGRKFLVDCGLFQGPKPIRQKNWEPINYAEDIDALILTHAHIDHAGLIPLLWKNGFRGKIYCSPATADLCRIMLPDSGKLQEEDAYFANRTRHSVHDPALPLYTQEDAFACLELLSPVPYHEWIQLLPELSFRLQRSAHILGSSFIEMNYTGPYKTTRLVFSGDLGNNRSLILKEADTVSEADELVLESTYGDRRIADINILESLGSIIRRVYERGGTLVIPAFSVGRTQELLYMVQILAEKKMIPSVPIYLDSPMAQQATAIYQKHESELKIEIKKGEWASVSKSMRYESVQTADESMLLCMDTRPKIVISAAGMLNGGRVLHHLRMKLPDPKSAVLFVGYQVPGTKGYLLKNQIGKIRIHHQLVDVQAEIISLDSLSAHADSNEIIKWVSQFRQKPRRIFLNHGEMPSLEALKYRLKTELNIDAIIPKEGDEIVIG